MKVIPSLAMAAAACFLGLLGATFGSAQVADAPANPRGATLSLRELSKGFEEAVERIRHPLTQLDSSYVDALDRLLQSETAAGNLENVVAVSAELHGFQGGTRFDPGAFDARRTNFAPLERYRTTYRTERSRLQESQRKELETLAQSYAARLAEIERSLTRAGDIDAAILVRNARASLENDPRLTGDSPEPEGVPPFNGRLHMIAKAELEIQHNGQELSYENSAPRTEGTNTLSPSPARLCSEAATSSSSRCGPTWSFAASSRLLRAPTARSPFHCERATIVIWVQPTNSPISTPQPSSGSTIVRNPGTPDPAMTEMWGTMPIPVSSRRSSEWAKCAPGGEWHTCAVVIKAGMISGADGGHP